MMEILIIILLLVVFLNQRRLRARSEPPRGSLEWEVRYGTRFVVAVVLASVATALWFS
jgi:hypothetical protein